MPSQNAQIHLCFLRRSSDDVHLVVEDKILKEGGASFYFDLVNEMRRTEFLLKGKHYPLRRVEERQARQKHVFCPIGNQLYLFSIGSRCLTLACFCRLRHPGSSFTLQLAQKCRKRDSFSGAFLSIPCCLP